MLGAAPGIPAGVTPEDQGRALCGPRGFQPVVQGWVALVKMPGAGGLLGPILGLR